MSEPNWIECEMRLPAAEEVVETKIHDAQGCRNETTLKLRGGRWFFADGSMYVYYNPTHWRPK